METYRELEVDLPEELLALKSAVHQFARDVMRPNSRKLDRFHDPKDTIAPDSPLREVLRAAYGLGYHTASLPERVGGLGLRGLAMHIMLEEMGWGSADLAISIAVTSFPFSSASMSGKPDLIEEFVKPFVRDTSGSVIGCWAITEPDHGTDQLAVGTSQFQDPKISGQVTAHLDGDVYIINGQKSAWVSNGTIATHAALFLNLDSSRGMAGGQAIDLACVDKALDLPELERMHRLKTGALIRAAVRLGADCGRTMDADGNDALLRYASAIGLAFQVVDDVLDVEGTAQSLGKTAGKDAVQRKSTYVTLLGLAAARERIEALRVEAREALSAFGTRARRLEELADWIALRTH